jgi:hypothetical protein
VITFRGDDQPELQVDLKLNDLGDLEDEAQCKKMQHMWTKNSEGEIVPYDFTGLKIVNSYVAQNSRYFCIGLVGDFKPDDTSRRNDKRSVLGIFKYDEKTRESTIEQWINQYPFKNFFVDDNMTTVMFLARNGRRLDYHFLLWDFDTVTKLKESEYRDLKTIDAGLIPGYDDKEDDKDCVVTAEELAKV